MTSFALRGIAVLHAIFLSHLCFGARLDTVVHTDDRAEQSSSESILGASTSDDELQVQSADPICAKKTDGRRVVSVADQHGDFDGMVEHLKRLGLIKSNVDRSTKTWKNAWRGGSTVFVQTGDVLDRGPDGKMQYEFLWELQDHAASVGGEVVLLIGNHELLVLKGDVRYVTNIDFCSYTKDNCGGKPPTSAAYCDDCCNYANRKCDNSSNTCLEGNCEFLASWDRDGEMGREMRKRISEGKMKLVHKAGSVIFTHAGLVSSIFGKIGSTSDPVSTLNERAASVFQADGRSLWYSNDIVAAGTLENGPTWTRMCFGDWHTRPGVAPQLRYWMDNDEFARVESSRCRTIAKSLTEVNATRMVIGHCPQGPTCGSSGVSTDCDGSFVQADTYMSIAYAGTQSCATSNLAALEFFDGDSKDKVWAVYSGRSDKKKCSKLSKAK